jgi:C_GCAxxG_C_C family probable redox protein
MSSKPDQASDCFRNGFNCAQAVFSTYSEEYGINKTDALKISCGMGAGMGRKQEVCGAISGAIMLIGSKHGKITREDNASTDKTYELVRELSDRFTAKHKSILCKDLLPCKLSTPEGQKIFRENNFKELKCARFVHDAAEIVEDLLSK